MSTEQNKVVVRRFVTEALSGRDVGLADEVLAPNYAAAGNMRSKRGHRVIPVNDACLAESGGVTWLLPAVYPSPPAIHSFAP